MSTRRKVLKLLAGAAIVGGVAGAIDVSAQVRAAAQTNPPASDRIALKGYDPVAYFTLSTPTPGVADPIPDSTPLPKLELPAADSPARPAASPSLSRSAPAAAAARQR